MVILTDSVKTDSLPLKRDKLYHNLVRVQFPLCKSETTNSEQGWKYSCLKLEKVNFQEVYDSEYLECKLS